MSRNMLAAAMTACALTLSAAATEARADGKPFKISGRGVATSGLPLPGQEAREHWSVGEATRLGHYHGLGTIETHTADFLPNGHIVGQFGSGSPYTFTAANGDMLVTEYGRTDAGAQMPGMFELVPAPEKGPGYYKGHFTAEFVPVPGESTGRFAGVTGSWIMHAETEPFLLGSTNPTGYKWHGEGMLNFPK